MHAFLAFVLVIGSAFFVNKERTQVVPTPMAGGGGIVVSGRFR